jgi:DNA polymerase type B, organellar and viral
MTKGLFNEYITELYEIKAKTKDKGEKSVTKLMLNGLYGFFGKQPVVTQLY